MTRLIEESWLRAAAAMMRELGDPVRIAVLDLLAAEARSASQLADELGISTPRLANHLARLRAAGMVTVARSGRHATYRLADPRVAEALRTLRALAAGGSGQDGGPGPRGGSDHGGQTSQGDQRDWSGRDGQRGVRRGADNSDRRPGVPEPGSALAEARTCYDHLAGRLGVAVFDHLVAAGALLAPGDADNSGVRLGPAAASGFAALGVDIASLPPRRKPATTCLDWTQRRPHLGGALGAAILDSALAAGWVHRGRGRALEVTPAGRRHLPAWGADPGLRRPGSAGRTPRPA